MRIRTVLVLAAAAGGGYLAWTLIRPGVRPVRRCAPVMTDLLRSQTERYRPVDAWAAPLGPDETDDADVWAWACFDSMRPAIALLVIRDAIVRFFGGVTWTGPDGFITELRATTGGSAGRSADLGDSSEGGRPPWISLRGDHEVVFGIDDKHLDFRLGIATLDDQVTVTTLFRLHNALGRAYWSVVQLFHPLIVRAMLRQVRVPACERTL